MSGLNFTPTQPGGIPAHATTGLAARLRHPIAAWGDSLTEGAGSSGGLTYPAQAYELFAPHRTIANLGLGGQTPAQVAARQGGVPIRVSVSGGTIPARQTTRLDWDFDDGTLQGGIHQTSGGGSIAASDGKVVVTAPSFLQGLRLPLGLTIPTNTLFTVTLDLVIPSGMTVRVSGFMDATIHWAARNLASSGDGVNISSSGTHTVELRSGNVAGTHPAMNMLVILTSAAPSGDTQFTIDNVSLTIPASGYAVSVPAKSVSAIPNGGTLSGTLAGIHGAMSSDGSGNWTFTRDTEGPAASCPDDSPFLPDAAASYRRHTSWIWVGHVGVVTSGDEEAAAASVAAMAGALPHSRYLVLSALPRSGRVPAVAAFNALLAERYGNRFVDVLGALQAAHDASEGDLDDLTAGLVPRSLRHDEAHLNNAGYAIVAATARAATLARGW